MNWLDRVIIELGNISVAIIYGFVIIVCVSLIFRDKEGKK